MTAHETDILYFGLSLLLPCLAVVTLKRGWIAIPLAALSHWLILEAAGERLRALDSERDSAAISDSLWFLFGWIQGLILAAILWSIKKLIQLILAKVKKKSGTN